MLRQMPINMADFPITTIGLAMTRNRIGGSHIGIVYRVADTLFLCHLPGPAGMVPDAQLGLNYWWEQAALDSDDAVIVVAFIRLMAKTKDRRVPYGFGYSGYYFDADGNWTRTDEPGAGLTCATFVMAIYQTLSLPLLEESTWKIREEDEEDRRRLLDEMKQSLQMTDLQRFEPYIQGVRYRPEEVGAGMMWNDPPLNFETAAATGEVIFNFLKEKVAIIALTNPRLNVEVARWETKPLLRRCISNLSARPNTNSQKHANAGQRSRQLRVSMSYGTQRKASYTSGARLGELSPDRDYGGGSPIIQVSAQTGPVMASPIYAAPAHINL